MTLKYVRHAFNDPIGGCAVNVYVDCYGDQWLKDNRWALFRVRTGG